MGITSWPCPKCGQVQTETHENGHEVQATRKCAACEEAEREAEVSNGAKKRH